jgi:hypothetical protein
VESFDAEIQLLFREQRAYCHYGPEMMKFVCYTYISLIRKKSDTVQFLWVTIGPTYKLTAGKLSVQYARFTYISVCSFWFFNFEYLNSNM